LSKASRRGPIPALAAAVARLAGYPGGAASRGGRERMSRRPLWTRPSTGLWRYRRPVARWPGPAAKIRPGGRSFRRSVAGRWRAVGAAGAARRRSRDRWEGFG